MKERNYNLELIRMISFIFVIVIHVSNYYCRAYGDDWGVQFFTAIKSAGKDKCTMFFHDHRSTSAWKRGIITQTCEASFTFSDCPACVERNIHDLECSLYERSLSNQRLII